MAEISRYPKYRRKRICHFPVAYEYVFLNSVHMNVQDIPEGTIRFDWREDLGASRDLSRNEIQAIGFIVAWFEEWSRKELRSTRSRTL